MITRWMQGLPRLRLNDSIGSLSAGMFMLMLNLVLFQGFELVGYVWVYNNYKVLSLPWDSPFTWWIALLGVDLAYYWFHRMAHGKSKALYLILTLNLHDRQAEICFEKHF